MDNNSEKMRILTIDQGNTTSKGVVWNGDSPEASVKMEELAIEELLPLIECGPIDGCAFCSVRHTDAKFLETLRRLVDGNLMVLTPSTPLPISVNYASRSTLGNDRVAAAVGAASKFPGEGLLVVDAGTAVTMDVVDANAVFQGGNIAPGVNMRLRILHEATSRLPLVAEEGDIPPFGYDTETAIRSGVFNGIVGEICNAFGDAVRLYDAKRVILTGSNASNLERPLAAHAVPVVQVPYLVGLGLIRIYSYVQNFDNKKQD